MAARSVGDQLLDIIQRLADEREEFSSDDLRPLLPAGATPMQIPSALAKARREGIVVEVGRVNSTIPERKGSLVPVFRSSARPPRSAVGTGDGGPALVEPVADDAVVREIRSLREYLEATGYLIDERHLATLILMMASRGWTVLAGPSGTGKSRIIRRLCDAFQGRFVDVQVKRNWTTSEELFGYFSEASAVWVPGPLQTALEATSDDELMFVRLDEMNLAPPEYYVAELISAGETWERVGGGLVSAPIQLPPCPPGKAPAPPRLRNGTLLFGTLNVDETTQPLSPKMLDRAAILDFEQVDLFAVPRFATVEPPAPDLSKLRELLLKRPRDLSMLTPALETPVLETVAQLLTDLDSYTRPLGSPLAYRPRDALVTALHIWRHSGFGALISEVEVLDVGIRALVLPRLQGSTPGTAQYLRGIGGMLAGDDGPVDGDIEVLRGRVGGAKYPRSYEKVIGMLDQLLTLGYFSFW